MCHLFRKLFSVNEKILERNRERKKKNVKMLCTSPPPPASPAGSEISVGAPSPPPQIHQQQHLIQQERRRPGDDYFRPLKRLKGISNERERSTSPPPLPPASRSSLEGVKSFSIADILGHDATNANNTTTSNNNNNHQPQNHHHQVNSKIVRPWDHLRTPVHTVRPFLPPALLHYEHRLALDYHRHLEHLNAQAQLLRHMNMTMDIIPSESGSDRSSSAASDCCSPEIGSSGGSRLSEHHLHHSSGHQQQQQQSSPSSHHHHSNGQMHNQKTKPNGTPLDALFQMTNKSFDESQGDNDTGIFGCCIACIFLGM